MAFLWAGCSGDEPPDPRTLVDRAFARDSLLEGPIGPTSVEVANLGFGGRPLEVRSVPVDAPTHREILRLLSSGSSGEGAATGLVSLAGDLETGEGGEVGGIEAYLVSGTIETADLVGALEGGGGEVGEELGVDDLESLREGLQSVGFTAWISKREQRLERLDLILTLDDPGNALPPSRIRFRLDDGGARPVGQDAAS